MVKVTLRFVRVADMKSARGFGREVLIAAAVVAIHCVCVVASSEGPEAVAPAAKQNWFVEVGPLWRAGGEMEFRIKSLPDISGYRPAVPPSMSRVGPMNAVADRSYDDGYVRRDYGTGVWDNNTWYWGYKSGEQIADGQLLFHSRTSSIVGDSFSPRDSYSLDLDDGMGAEARIGGRVFGSNRVRGSLVVGVGFSSFDGSTGFEDLGYVRSYRAGRITDTYNLFTDPGAVPPAPYSGTKEGPGYIIPNIPVQRQISSGRGSPATEIYHNVRQDVDVDLWVASFGLDVRGGCRTVSYVAGAGFSANFVGADSAFRLAATENGVVLDSACYSEDANAFEWGMYGEVGVVFHLSRRVSLGLRGRYDYMLDDAELSFSKTNAKIDLSGFSALANLGISF
jgi:hypothetical protein